MQIIVNQKNNKRALLLIKSEEDLETYNYLKTSIFGLYQTWVYDIKNPKMPEEDKALLTALLKKYPTLRVVGWLNDVEGFVNNHVEDLNIKQELLNFKET